MREPTSEVLRQAFWEAMRRCDDEDDRIHAIDMPCFSRGHKDGGDQLIDGYLPDEIWEHMRAVLIELHDVVDETT